MEDIDFRVDFIAKNSNKLQKLGLEGKKISWVLNVFTLGPTARATRVKKNTMKWTCIYFKIIVKGMMESPPPTHTLMIASTQTHSAFVPSMQIEWLNVHSQPLLLLPLLSKGLGLCDPIGMLCGTPSPPPLFRLEVS